MKWETKIKQWSDGKPQTYPKHITKRFYYETSWLDPQMKNTYHSEYIESKQLDILIQNKLPFQKKLNLSSNPHVTAFWNLNKTTRLIVPIPRKNKDYKTMKDFIDNASKTQQIAFWKRVAKEIMDVLKIHPDKDVYISTHGLGVHYFHFRIEWFPKYYLTKKFIK